MTHQQPGETQSKTAPRPARRLGYILLACLALATGIAGLLLPLLPATPFILLSAWSAAKGSPRLHRWIWNQPRLANHLHAWHEQGAICKQTKWLATIMLLISWLLLFLMNIHWILLAVATLFLTGIGLFIWSRPLPRYSRSLCNELK